MKERGKAEVVRCVGVLNTNIREPKPMEELFNETARRTPPELGVCWYEGSGVKYVCVYTVSVRVSTSSSTFGFGKHTPNDGSIVT